MLSAFGVICGILVHTLAAALGLTLILQTSAFAFLLVKYLGAIYLITLGVKAWRETSTFSLQTSTPGLSFRRVFWQGVLSSVLNPKIAIFFLAFLPQFVDKAGSDITLQMVILGLTFACFGLCADSDPRSHQHCKSNQYHTDRLQFIRQLTKLYPGSNHPYHRCQHGAHAGYTCREPLQGIQP